MFYDGHAVTIGNLIIFSREPDLTDYNDLLWLLHEIHHVEQYAKYSGDVLESIDGFALGYISNYSSIERDAQNSALYRIEQLRYICRNIGC